MKTKILVVEDESIIAFDIKMILENEGYEVIIDIKSVEAAIACIESHHPQLVLIDINLNQNKDGTHLGSYLLERDTIPYIYVTSYSNKITLDKVNKTRPLGYLVKPFKPQDLLSIVSIVLNNFNHKKIDTHRLQNPTEDVIPFKIKNIITYINTNIEKKLEVSELLLLTNWTKRHFGRLFMQYLNVSPYQYILNKKIEKAKSLLKETNIPINEIAFELGFQSYSSFCTVFKKMNLVTPEVYRKQNKSIVQAINF